MFKTKQNKTKQNKTKQKNNQKNPAFGNNRSSSVAMDWLQVRMVGSIKKTTKQVNTPKDILL